MSNAVELTVLPAEAAMRLRISVCIPARNEAATVGRVVSPIVAALAGPERLVDEVIVVDDGSSDGTGAIAEAFGAQVVRRHGLPGKGAAMAEAPCTPRRAERARLWFSRTRRRRGSVGRPNARRGPWPR